MDLSAALQHADQLAAIRHFAEMIQFEGELLEICKQRHLSRIVRLIEQGTLDGAVGSEVTPVVAAASRVYFFIFELADGDVRHRFSRTCETDCSLKLRALHQTATAVAQLHGSSIAHQDVKPSNVVSFNGNEHKLADLGRASLVGRLGPTDDLPFAGDLTYMPPEYAYGFTPPDALDRRFGTDVYLLGSLIAFLFTLQGSSALLRQRVPDHVLPRVWSTDPESAWNGSFADALPHLVKAHGEVSDYLSQQIPTYCSGDLSRAYFELAHPDPLVRGHPKARRQVGRPLGLERYISLFDLLSKRSSVNERLARIQSHDDR
jgi:serine/threonine protein kinase